MPVAVERLAWREGQGVAISSRKLAVGREAGIHSGADIAKIRSLQCLTAL